MKAIALTVSLLLFSFAAQAATLVLNPPAGYPTLLGVSCGGVIEDSYATGFDANGNPTAAVYAYTKCNQGGRGGKVVTYSSWNEVAWDLKGNVLSITLLSSAPTVSTSAQYDDSRGDTELTSETWTVHGYQWIVELETP